MNDDNFCIHLYEIDNAQSTYSLVLAYYVTCIAEGSRERKANEVKCSICKSVKRIHACLECAFFGCFEHKEGENSHMKCHFLKGKHCFAININYGSLFCFKCDDYVYNEILEETSKEFKLEAIKISDDPYYLPWTPNAKERAVLKNKIKTISPKSYFGLRGIINIGNKCYINAVIQVLTHTPMLRDYFLSDLHVCESKGKCLTCELFILFQEFYSGNTLPYNPAERLFRSMLKFSRSIFEGEQGDSFELYQEVLGGLHAGLKPENAETMNCDCVIHEIFYGINQSYKVCSKCKFSSLLPLEYFLDIPLYQEKKDDSLIKILNRKYLQSDLLHDLKCEACGYNNTTSMYHAIKKLPQVISFRINCFNIEQRRNIRKKATNFKYEEYIDMTPYLNMKKEVKAAFRDSACNIDAFENRYCLYGIIVHKGTISAGHYFTFLRHRDRWYECNDKFVYERSMEVAFKSEPYMLFYFKYQ